MTQEARESVHAKAGELTGLLARTGSQGRVRPEAPPAAPAPEAAPIEERPAPGTPRPDMSQGGSGTPAPTRPEAYAGKVAHLADLIDNTRTV